MQGTKSFDPFWGRMCPVRSLTRISSGAIHYSRSIAPAIANTDFILPQKLTGSAKPELAGNLKRLPVDLPRERTTGAASTPKPLISYGRTKMPFEINTDAIREFCRHRGIAK